MPGERNREWPTVYHKCLQCGKAISGPSDTKWEMVRVEGHCHNMPFHTNCSTIPIERADSPES